MTNGELGVYTNGVTLTMLKKSAIAPMISYMSFCKQAAYDVMNPREQRGPDAVCVGKVLG